MHENKIYYWMQINGYVDLESIKAFYERIEKLSIAVIKSMNIKENEMLVWALDINAEKKGPILNAILGLCGKEEQMSIFMLLHIRPVAPEFARPTLLKNGSEYAFSLSINFEGEKPVAQYNPDNLPDSEMAARISRNPERFKTPKLGVDY